MPIRILVVEDDPTTLRTIELILDQAEMEVDTTNLGEEAIDLLKQHSYDFVTLGIDLGHEKTDGYKVLRTMRGNGDLTPVMMLTGRDDINSKTLAFSFGCDDYLTKPFHHNELIAKISAIYRRFEEKKAKAI